MSVDEVRAAMLTNRLADQLREIARLEAENASLLEANRALAADLERWSDQGKRLEAEVARLRGAIEYTLEHIECHFWRCVDALQKAMGHVPDGEVAPDSGVVKKSAENGAGTQPGPIPDVEVDQ